MDLTPSLWEGILQRASALRRRYGNLSEAPQDTWSLVNRVAADKLGGSPVASGRDRSHVYGLWTKAMYCVLNDLHRRQSRRPARITDEPLSQVIDPRVEEQHVDQQRSDAESLALLEETLRELARRDGEMGEEKALIVALKYFEGLTWEELASTLGSSVRRMRDEWAVTRAWLRRELRKRGVELD